MTLGLMFWILMLLWVVLSLAVHYYPGWGPWPGTILLFLLFLCLGWKVFGAPIHG